MNIIPNNFAFNQNFGAYSITGRGLNAINNLKKTNDKNEYAALLMHFKNTKYAKLFIDAIDCFCQESGKFETKIVPYIEIPEKLDLPLHKYIRDIRVRPYKNSNYNLQVEYYTMQNKLCTSIVDFPSSVTKFLKKMLNADSYTCERNTDNIRIFGDAIESKFTNYEPHQQTVALSEKLNDQIDRLFEEQNL